MSRPTGQLESELWLRDCRYVVGLDEAGRGSWAGPVVAAALVFDPDLKKLKSINDSKLLPPAVREKLFESLTGNFVYGVGVVASRIIDALGILAATKLAMNQAIENLPTAPDYLLIDAVHLENYPRERQQNIIKGDSLVLSIAAASIIAKVTRDRLMEHYHQVYETYGFNRHKGYGTSYHLAALERHGVCPIHRQSYEPVRRIIGGQLAGVLK